MAQNLLPHVILELINNFVVTALFLVVLIILIAIITGVSFTVNLHLLLEGVAFTV